MFQTNNWQEAFDFVRCMKTQDGKKSIAFVCSTKNLANEKMKAAVEQLSIPSSEILVNNPKQFTTSDLALYAISLKPECLLGRKLTHIIVEECAGDDLDKYTAIFCSGIPSCCIIVVIPDGEKSKLAKHVSLTLIENLKIDGQHSSLKMKF